MRKEFVMSQATLQSSILRQVSQKVFDEPVSVQTALSEIGAGYTIKKQPIVALDDDIMAAIDEGADIPASRLTPLIVDGVKATMRMDTKQAMGIVSPSYGVVQNIDAFRFVDTFCNGIGGDKPVITSAGSFGGGSRIIINAKFPEPIVLNSRRDDLLEMYVVFTTTHNGKGGVVCMVTPTRVLCNNTLPLALKTSIGRITFQHRARVMDRMELANQENAQKAYTAIGVYEVYEKAFKRTYERLGQVNLNERQVDEVIAKSMFSDKVAKVLLKTRNIEDERVSVQTRNKFTAIKEVLEGGIGQSEIDAGNGQWLINGLTTYFQNYSTYQNDETKFDSIMIGQNYDKVNKALSLVLKY